jgi:hypothetical protein
MRATLRATSRTSIIFSAGSGCSALMKPAPRAPIDAVRAVTGDVAPAWLAILFESLPPPSSHRGFRPQCFSLAYAL